MFGYAPIGAMVWYGAFFISIVVITLNLLVAMVYDHYTIIKSRAGSVAGVLEQLHWNCQDMAARVKGKSLWVKLTCCLRRHEGIPQHRDLLEHFMEQAQLPTYERKAINSTVLGAKWTKKDRHGVSEIAETMENEPILKDFEQFEINPDYKDSLQAHSKEYADAGYDPEDGSQIVRLSSALDERRLRTSFLRAVQSSAAEAGARAERPSGTQRRSRPTVTTLYGSDGLEEILYQELRRGGAVPTKLDRWWCVSGVAGVHPRSASRARCLVLSQRAWCVTDELSEYVQALLEPHALHKAVSALRAKMKVQRYNLRSSLVWDSVHLSGLTRAAAVP
eukprot:g2551.t1